MSMKFTVVCVQTNSAREAARNIEAAAADLSLAPDVVEKDYVFSRRCLVIW
ncbi:MAG: hypothetical protein WAN51_02130 [Alphaproteobacteria bacterium]